MGIVLNIRHYLGKIVLLLWNNMVIFDIIKIDLVDKMMLLFVWG